MGVLPDTDIPQDGCEEGRAPSRVVRMPTLHTGVLGFCSLDLPPDLSYRLMQTEPGGSGEGSNWTPDTLVSDLN